MGIENIESTFDSCFGCGAGNPSGLQLDPRMQVVDGEMVIRTNVAPRFQGFSGIVHGGISTTLLDEAMSAWCSRVLEVQAVTAEINVVFRHPVPTEAEVLIRARGTRNGRKVACTGEICDQSGKVLVEATGLWIITAEKAAAEIQ